MTLNELIAEVYTLTGRPDLVAETALAVKKATLKLHSVDFFYRDLQEVIRTLSTPGFKQQLDLVNELGSYRAIKYVREWNATATGSEKFFEKVEPDAIINQYRKEATNIFYVAGDMLNIKSSTTLTNITIGFYRQPNISANLYSSWIAVEQPFAIIEEAAATLFQMIGHAEMARKFESLSSQNIILLRQNFLDPQAR